MASGAGQPQSQCTPDGVDQMVYICGSFVRTWVVPLRCCCNNPEAVVHAVEKGQTNYLISRTHQKATEAVPHKATS